MSRMLKALQQLESAAKHAVTQDHQKEERSAEGESAAGQGNASAATATPSAAAEPCPAIPTCPDSQAVPAGAKWSAAPPASMERRLSETLERLLDSVSKETSACVARCEPASIVATPPDPTTPAASDATPSAHSGIETEHVEPRIEPAGNVFENQQSDVERLGEIEAATDNETGSKQAAAPTAEPYSAVAEAIMGQMRGPCPVVLLVPCEAARAQTAVLEPLAAALRDRLAAAVRVTSGDELAGSPDWQVTLRQWRSGHRVVLVAGPSSDGPWASRLAAFCDGTYLILRLGQTSRRAAHRAIARLEADGGHVLGCVLVTHQ